MIWSSLLVILFQFTPVVSATEAGFCRNCEESSFLSLSRLKVLQDLDCRPLQVGQYWVVNQDHKQSPTKVPRHYVLRRQSEDHYVIEFSLRFLEARLSRVLQSAFSSRESSLESKMRARVNHCLKVLNPKLKGPSGKRLEIRVVSPSSNRREHRQIRLPIDVHTKANSTVHSRAYRPDMSCKVVLHELLHLAGLADEYVETRDRMEGGEQAPDSACRVFGTPNSIMGESAREQKKGKPTRWARLSGVVCECTDLKKCGSQQAPKTGCSKAGFAQRFRSVDVVDGKHEAKELSGFLAPPSFGMFTAAKALPYRVVKQKLVRYREVPEDSLLMPGHFRALTLPFCKSKNRKYFTCAARSKRQLSTVQKILGKTECSRLPLYCGTGEWLK